MKNISFVLIIIFILLIIFPLIKAEEEPPVITEGISMVVEGGIVSYFFTQEGDSITLGKSNFGNFQPVSEGVNAFISTDSNGNIIGLDVTTKGESSIDLGEISLNVPEGIRIASSYGDTDVFGVKEGDSINVKFSSSDTEFKQINFKGLDSLEEKKYFFNINKDHISGTNFEFDGVGLIDGGFTMGEKGIVLDPSTKEEGIITAIYGGMGISNKDLLLISKNLEFGNNVNVLYKDDLGGIVAQGKDFSLNFQEGNPYSLIEKGDKFSLQLNGGSFSFQSRNSEEKIPLLSIQGKVDIAQDGKIYEIKPESLGTQPESGYILIKPNKALVGKEGLVPYQAHLRNIGTSPIEVRFDSSSENLRLVIDNFNRVTILPKDEEQGIANKIFSDFKEAKLYLNAYNSFDPMKYENSIYFKEVSTGLKYNYPTKEHLEKLIGGKVNFLVDSSEKEELLNNPENIRIIIDFFETLTLEQKESFTSINFYSQDLWDAEFGYSIGGVFKHADFSVNLPISGAKNKVKETQSFAAEKDLGVFRHEYSHLFFSIDPELFEEGDESLGLEKNLKFFEEWNEINGEINGRAILDKRNLWAGIVTESEKLPLRSDRNAFGPREGYIRPYGASANYEDVATFVEKIVSDPGFFKREGLLEGQEDYNPKYKQKVDLLFSKGVISKEEYDAVFNPEKYGIDASPREYNTY